MNSRSLRSARIILLGSSLLAATTALHAADYWWNQNGTDAGWGGAGTWSTSSAVFSTVNSDTAAAASATTTTSDTLTIGTSTVPFVGGATITVSGTQNIGTISFTSTSGGTSTITGTGSTLNFASTGTITNSGTQQLVIGSVITGAGTALDLYASTGQITLTTPSGSSYGVLNVRTGRVAVNSQNSFGGTGAGKNTVVFDGATLVLNSTSGAFTEAITISGAGFGSNPGSLIAGNASGQNPSLSGAVTLGASARIGVVDGGVNANSLSLSGAINVGANTVTFNPAGSNSSINVSNAISGTGGSVTKTGLGTLNLTANNTYTGDTTISQGVLVVGGGAFTGSLGNHSNTFIDSGAELRIDIATNTSNFGYDYSGELSGSGTVNILADRRMNFRNLVGGGNQTSSGNLAFIVNGRLGIHTSSGVNQVHLGELSGSGLIQRAGSAPTTPTPPYTLIIGGKNTSSTYSGTISSFAELTVEKVGTGTLTLTSSLSHGSGTNVTGGTLLVNGSLATSTNAVSVGANGTLGGTGTIAGATSVTGTLAAGNAGLGRLQFSNNLTFNADSIFAWEVNGSSETGRGTNYDAVNVGGTLGGTDGIFRAVLTSGSFADTFWQSNRSWTDIFKTADAGSNIDFQDFFNSFQYFEGTTDVTAGISTYGSFSISGSTLNWTTIPEPTSALAGLLLGFGLLRRRRA
jgi:autotransporter-associated beta strand protein